ncbi:MAG: acyl--CoA ligase, partial [Acidiferrobacteraceae bacterium]|nr:acyl--CoA ligase [Acidiferrobacteraceae bacterium]
MNLGTWLERTARHDPDRPALFLGQDQVATYGQFHHRAGQVAAWLESQGIQIGDRVGIFMKNVPDYLIVLYGIWYAGAAAVPINAKLHGREARFILENSGTRLTFATGELVRALTEAGVTSPVLDTDNPAFAE